MRTDAAGAAEPSSTMHSHAHWRPCSMSACSCRPASGGRRLTCVDEVDGLPHCKLCLRVALLQAGIPCRRCRLAALLSLHHTSTSKQSSLARHTSQVRCAALRPSPCCAASQWPPLRSTARGSALALSASQAAVAHLPAEPCHSLRQVQQQLHVIGGLQQRLSLMHTVRRLLENTHKRHRHHW